jgi:basic membrane protein A and related proteins
MVRFIAAAAAVAVFAAGCGSSGSKQPTASSGGGSNVKPGVVTDIGGLGDHGFNDLAQAGLKLAVSRDGVKGRVLVPQTPADYANDLTQLARSGAQPVYGIGFTFADTITQMADQFPKTHFAIVDAVVDKPNVVSLVFREEEGSYLAGLVAGKMTQVKTPYTNASNKVVGFIGGQESPLIEKFGAGYEQGVKDACPSCTVLYQYVGSTTQAFSDPGTASEIARNMHAKGADVIYHAAGASGDGLFKVAGAEKFFAIGVNVDQTKTNPEAPILTSVLKRVDTAVADTVHAQVAGTFKAGVQSFGLSNDGIALAPFGRFDSLVPAELKTAVADAQKKIVDGDLKVATKLSEVKGG